MNTQHRDSSFCRRSLSVLMLFSAVALTGCGGGGDDGGSAASASAPPASESAPRPTNQSPTISGAAPATVAADSAYTFTPSAADPEGSALTFSIQNKPSWATFTASNGRLSGTPTAADVGTYSNIVITVSDGQASTTLPAFAIAVNAMATGSATLSWTAPTQNTDGSALANLSGYRINYGTSPTALTRTVTINNAGTTMHVLENLSAGTWHFSIVALANGGQESAASNVVSKRL